MRKKLVVIATLLSAALLPCQVIAGTFGFEFEGPGVSGLIWLTYGSATDSKYPQALEVTGVSGFFTDINNGLALSTAWR